MKRELENALTRLLDVSCDVVDLRVEKRSLTIEVQYHDTTFEELEKLSVFFGTKNININSESRETGHCETCRGTETYTLLYIKDITKGLS